MALNNRAATPKWAKVVLALGLAFLAAGALLLYKSRQLERRMEALLRATQQAHPSKAPPNVSAR